MAQPAPAPTTAPQTIAIDGNYVARPSPTPTVSYSNGGQIQFNAAIACVVNFNPTDVFGASVTLNVGNNAALSPQRGNVTVDYWVNPPQESAEMAKEPETGPYVIPVGS